MRFMGPMTVPKMSKVAGKLDFCCTIEQLAYEPGCRTDSGPEPVAQINAADRGWPLIYCVEGWNLVLLKQHGGWLVHTN